VRVVIAVDRRATGSQVFGPQLRVRPRHSPRARRSRATTDREARRFGWPGQLVVRVRERASDAQEATHNPTPFASCGSASLRHPDNKLSGPTETCAQSFKSLYFHLAALLLAIFTLTACHHPNSRAYDGHGIIQHISDDRHLVTIQHDAIPGYMPAMTMDFSVRDPHVLEGLTRGDQIDFILAATPDDAWIAVAKRTGHTDLPAETAAIAAPTLNPGDLLPNAEFIAENGRHVHLSDFRGKAIALTFFFTRCPLPNYCPLMNRNFAAARAILLAQPNGPDNWQFLSISFDPDFDTSQQLAASAELYRDHNADRWLFVSATPETLSHFAAPLGLMILRQDNSMTHNLRTVVVDPQGKIFRQYNDNLWTPDQLAGVIRDAAEAPATK
jgi:protein SCO1/2